MSETFERDQAGDVVIDAESGERVSEMTVGGGPKELAPVGGELTPSQLIELAIQKGVDPEKLTVLVELKERVDRAEAKKSFARAMARVQSETPNVVRDSRNDHTNSAYASLEAVQKIVRPVLQAHGLTIIFSDGESPRDNWVRVVATVTHEDGHSEEYHRDGPMDDKGPKGGSVKSQLHGIQSTASYLRRKLLESITGMVEVNEDDDGNGGPDEESMSFEDAARLSDMVDGLRDDTKRRFWDWLGVDSFELLPASRYDELHRFLKGKLAAEGNS